MKKWYWIGGAVIAVLLVVVAIMLSWGWLQRQFFKPRQSTVEQAPVQTEPEVVAQNLAIPWEIAFLPNKDILVTERPGTLKRIGANQQSHPIEGVHHQGEGGLMGLALHPNFEANDFIYLYLTTKSGEGLTNRVERYRYDDDKLQDRRIIINNIPGAAVHDGGRIAFGPDGLLYITTGDATKENLAQDTGSVAGKILRLKDDGGVPADNPFGNGVYSYGHRNAQGLAWDDKGQLWATEHGPSGTQSGFDELNLIRKGANYGWPLIRGDQTQAGMEAPVIQSGAEDTWAPAGMAFNRGSLWFSGLRGESLYQAEVKADGVFLRAHYSGRFGRLRAVVTGPDGKLYISTSNTDGRGDVRPGDDQIIKIDPLAIN